MTGVIPNIGLVVVVDSPFLKGTKKLEIRTLIAANDVKCKFCISKFQN